MMKSIRAIIPGAAGLGLAVAVLAGCSGGDATLLPSTQPERSLATAGPSRGYVYVSERTAQGASKLLVYPAGVRNPSPTSVVTQGLRNAAGVALDPSGNVYVANGGAGNVLEFSPGAASLVMTYSEDLVNPVGVTVANGTLYVADSGNASNGYLQQVLEFKIGNGEPFIGIGGIGGPSQLNEAVAVNPLARTGTFFASGSTLSNIPPQGSCLDANAYTVAENLMPTLWMLIPLSQNEQASGLAFDSKGNLYAADICNNKVQVYSQASYVWTYSGSVAGTFSGPLFLTISKQLLAVPSSGNRSTAGYVSIIDLTGRTSTITITKGLDHPAGAAVTGD